MGNPKPRCLPLILGVQPCEGPRLPPPVTLVGHSHAPLNLSVGAGDKCEMDGDICGAARVVRRVGAQWLAPLPVRSGGRSQTHGVRNCMAVIMIWALAEDGGERKSNCGEHHCRG